MTDEKTQSGRERGIIYVVALVLLIVLAVIALLTFRAGRQSAAAEQKATELTQALQEAGMKAPSTEQIVLVLGEDGGVVCADPNAALARALALQSMANGSAGPGTRPVIASDRIVRSQLLIMGVYCPEQLPDYRKFVDGLQTVKDS